MPWDELTHILSVTAYILRLFFGLSFLAHWRNVPLTTGINMSKNRDGILLVLTVLIISQSSTGRQGLDGAYL